MSSDDAQKLAERCGAAMWAEDTASKSLGMSLENITPGMAVLTMPVGEKMVNGHGTCHGGFIFTLADSAFAFACNSRNQASVAAACDISFVRAARRGDVLTASAREVYLAGRNGIYDVKVTDQNDAAIALFRGKSRTIGSSILPGNANEGKP